MPIDIEALLQPISGEQPSGADIRYHPLTDQIKEARRQEDDLAQGVWTRDVKAADYLLVIKLAKEALTKRSKDLQIAAWLTEALLHQEGFGGLRQGLELISKMLTTYWDSVYPEIDEDNDLELRATPLRWVASQLSPAVRSVPLTKSGHNWFQYKQSLSIPSENDAQSDSAKQDQRNEALSGGGIPPEDFERGLESTPPSMLQPMYDELAGLIESVQTFGASCDEKFGEESPDFGPLRNSIEEVQATVRIFLIKKGAFQASGPAPDEPTEPKIADDRESWNSGNFAAAPAAAPMRRGTAGREPSDPEDAIQQILAAARYLRRELPYSLMPYMIPRAVRWSELRATGGYPDASVLAAPPTEVRVELKRLASEGSWEQVRDAAENAAGQPCGRAWLDLQRYAVTACQNTGADLAARAIIAELKTLVEEIPQLPDWTLADDTPTANAETQQWLRTELILPAPPDALPVQPAPIEWPSPAHVTRTDGSDGSLEDPVSSEPYDLAMEAARSGRIEEALGILSREIAQERSGRNRFLRKVQLAQLCLATANDGIAQPILQELADEIERRNLEEWELTEVVAQPLALLFRCLGNSDETAEQKRKLYAHLCRLDPARALGLAR